MPEQDQFPAWAWPTPTAKLLHYFPAKGEPSLCRRYQAGMPVLMEFPNEGWPAFSASCCSTCRTKFDKLESK